jgi:hypothetical protein
MAGTNRGWRAWLDVSISGKGKQNGVDIPRNKVTVRKQVLR